MSGPCGLKRSHPVNMSTTSAVIPTVSNTRLPRQIVEPNLLCVSMADLPIGSHGGEECCQRFLVFLGQVLAEAVTFVLDFLHARVVSGTQKVALFLDYLYKAPQIGRASCRERV